MGGCDGKVRAYDISGGFAGKRAVWVTQDLGGEVSGLAVHSGTVVAAAGRVLTALDRDTAERRVLYTAATLITAAPVTIAGLIYVASLDGTVCCLSMTPSTVTG